MKLFLDTNVVIDVIAAREPFVADSQTILSICETGEATGIVSTLTFARYHTSCASCCLRI